MASPVQLERPWTWTSVRSAPRFKLALAATVFAGGGLRFATIDLQSFWRDEAATAVVLDQPLSQMLGDIVAREATPPGYYLVAWLWTQVFGLGDVSLRSLSALLGTLTIPVAYAIGGRLAARPGGLAAALLVAFNPFLVWFSQEARAYVLLVLLTAVATALWLDVLRSQGIRLAITWGVVAAAALWTHYHAVFILLPQALALIWLNRHSVRDVGAIVVLPLLAGLALLPLLLDQRDGRVGWLSESSLSSRVVDIPKHWIAGPVGTPVDGLAGLAGALVVIGLVLSVVRVQAGLRRRRVGLGAVAGAALMVPVLLAIAGVDYVLDRYLIAALVPLLALVAAGLVRLPRAGHVLAGALVASSLFFTLTHAVDPELHRDDWRATARQLARLPGPVAIVLPAEDSAALLRYVPDAEALTAPARVRTVATVTPWRFGRERPAEPSGAPVMDVAGRWHHTTMSMVLYSGPDSPVSPEQLSHLSLRRDRVPMVLRYRGAPGGP